MENLDKSIFKSKEAFLSLANILPYPFIIAEVSETKIKNLLFNTELEKEFGYVSEEIKSLDEWFEKAFPNENYRREMKKTWLISESVAKENKEQFIKIKAKITSKNKIEKWYEVKAFTVENLYVLAYVDINKEILLQEELKIINQNNDRMLSVLGHDLRSPIANLTVISSMAANNEITNQEFISLVALINKESNQVLGLLETTFNWAKLNLNSIEVKKVLIDYFLLTTSLKSTYNNILEDKNIDLRITIDNSIRPETDFDIILVILRNLLTNAIKFSHANSVIELTITKNEITITDFGVGMSSEKQESITNRSNFCSTRGTNNEPGIGMGLQLVLNLVDKIDARLKIESQINVGTSFKVIFS